jgi:hypothetical protein
MLGHTVEMFLTVYADEVNRDQNDAAARARLDAAFG